MIGPNLQRGLCIIDAAQRQCSAAACGAAAQLAVAAPARGASARSGSSCDASANVVELAEEAQRCLDCALALSIWLRVLRLGTKYPF